ncbi:MAG: hypothetical protein VCB77_02825, partial [Alphaproteobacteria bacterium]
MAGEIVTTLSPPVIPVAGDLTWGILDNQTPASGAAIVPVAVEKGRYLIDHIAAGGFLEHDADGGGEHPDGTAEQAAASNLGAVGDFIAGHATIDRGQYRRVLQRIDQVDHIIEGERIVAPEAVAGDLGGGIGDRRRIGRYVAGVGQRVEYVGQGMSVHPLRRKSRA